MKIKTCFSQKSLGHFYPNFVCCCRYIEIKICKYDAGHMTKMAAMPIYGKNPSNIFSGTSRLISMKPGM